MTQKVSLAVLPQIPVQDASHRELAASRIREQQLLDKIAALEQQKQAALEPTAPVGPPGMEKFMQTVLDRLEALESRRGETPPPAPKSPAPPVGTPPEGEEPEGHCDDSDDEEFICTPSGKVVTMMHLPQKVKPNRQVAPLGFFTTNPITSKQIMNPVPD